MVKVYYDHHCLLCKELARLCQSLCAGRMAFVPWQHFSTDPPLDIAVEVDGQLLRDQMAWEWITKNFPVLSSLDWFANRMGLRPGRTSGLVRRSAHILRMLCGSCSSDNGFKLKKRKTLAR